MKKTIFFLIIILSYSLSAQTWGNREYWISYEYTPKADQISEFEKAVKEKTNKKGWKIYELNGTLFFASVQNFQDLFDYKNDPKDVIIDFNNSKVVDHSAIMAIDNIANKYKKIGKKLHLVHLSPECLEILDTAKDMVEVNLLEDPKYHIADDKLS